MDMQRRYDLDWLRIAAFGLLILYHVGMVFVTWDFHIKTAHPARWVEAPMLLLNPWRLSLLFLISGAASRFVLAKRAGAGGFARDRSARLLLPVLFAVAVVVPPQAWVDVTVNHSYAHDFLTFWTRDYWRFDKSLGVVVPTYNHLWFVVYLWCYTMLLAGGAAVLRGRGARLQSGFDRLFGGWRLIVLPLAWFAAERIGLNDRFPETHALIDDWGMHLVYGFAFLFGVGVAGSRTAWATIARVWPWAGVAALAGWVLIAASDLAPGDSGIGVPIAIMRVARSVELWGAILGLLGFAQRYWNRDHRWRAALNEAVFPAYIAHQTVIVVVEFWLRPLGLPGWSEFAILVVATAGGAALFTLIARALGWLRPFAGFAARSQRSARPLGVVA